MPEKTKATTLQQKFGFVDSDLKTPKHDEIMIWLDSNMKEIAAKREALQWTQKEVDRVKEEIESIARKIGIATPVLGEPPEKPPVEEIRIVWEHPIATGADNRFIVGFVDMAVFYTGHSLGVGGLEYDSSGNARGFKAPPTWQIYRESRKFFFRSQDFSKIDWRTDQTNQNVQSL